MKITRTSTLTGNTHTLNVPCTPEQYLEYLNGKHVQDAMPDVPKELREFVKSGITPKEWETAFNLPRPKRKTKKREK